MVTGTLASRPMLILTLAVTDCLSGMGELEIVEYFSQLYGTGIDVLSMPNTCELQFAEGGFFLSKLPPDHSPIATHPSTLANDHQTSFR